MCNQIVDKIVKTFTLHKIDADDLILELKRINPHIQVVCTDEWYQLRKKKEVEKFLEDDDTDKMQYVATIFDCDDYAVRLLGQFTVPKWSGACIGILMIGYNDKENGHALNIFMDVNEKLWIIEPQDDTITDFHIYMKKHNAYPYLALFI